VTQQHSPTLDEGQGLTICKPYPGVDSHYRPMSAAMSALGLGRVETHWIEVPEYDWGEETPSFF
jgi:hypothetical protein